ncbi:MAG: exo-alpha-sialidase [Bacteroidales bacterium]|nr:exo-alpha-sialidase [Bacteroidales bacterium]
MKRVAVALAVVITLISCGQKSSSTKEQTVADTAFELCLFKSGDLGSARWRIPAILCLDDGSLLITCDKRKNNYRDLPEDIDIVSSRSTDGGRTWSNPVTIVAGTGYKHGYGDAALVQCENGDIICAFAGGNGYFASTENDPIRTYICRSTDRGHTWGKPRELTAMLWGSQAVNSATRDYRGAFFSSGNGLRLRRGTHAGRIMFALPMLRKAQNTSDNFVVYSDDNGETWQVSDMAYAGGDEAKLMELSDGTILLSTRQNGARGYNRSTDGGHTWGAQGKWEEMTTNACNGDMLRVMATDQGDSINLLLHSIPNSMQRANVSLFVSHDEGHSWASPLLLCNGPSVYSSMTLLPTRGIGIFMEKGPDTNCELWYKYIPYRELFRLH